MDFGKILSISFAVVAVTIVSHNATAIFATFSKYNSLYFYALLTGNFATVLYAVLFLILKLSPLDQKSTIAVDFFTQLGLLLMVFCSSLVIYSRFSILNPSNVIKKLSIGFLSVSLFLVHIPILISALFADFKNETALKVYEIYNEFGLFWFWSIETFFNVVYLFYIYKLVKNTTCLDKSAFRKSVLVLFCILLMDVSVLVVDFVAADVEGMLKVWIYALKYRAEFYILQVLKDTFQPKTCKDNSVV